MDTGRGWCKRFLEVTEFWLRKGGDRTERGDIQYNDTQRSQIPCHIL